MINQKMRHTLPRRGYLWQMKVLSEIGSSIRIHLKCKCKTNRRSRSWLFSFCPFLSTAVARVASFVLGTRRNIQSNDTCFESATQASFHVLFNFDAMHRLSHIICERRQTTEIETAAAAAAATTTTTFVICAAIQNLRPKKLAVFLKQ